MAPNTGLVSSNAITTDDIPEYGNIVLDAGLTPLFLGEPGIGKTVAMRILAQMRADRLGLKMVDGNPKKGEYGFWTTVLANHEAIDFSVPWIENGKQKRAMLDILPTSGPGFWNGDEAGQNPDVFRIMAQIFGPAKCLNNDYHVPKGVDTAMTSNRAEDRAGSSRMYTHLLNRVVQFTVQPTVDGFLKYHGKNLVPEIGALLRWFPELLSTFDPKKTEAFASCRSWDMLNNMILHGGLVPAKHLPAVQGVVGSRAGAEFRTVCKTMTDIPDVDGLIADPEGNKDVLKNLAHSPTLACAFSIVLTKRVERDVDLYGDCIKVIERVSDEWAVSFTRLALTREPLVADHPEYGAFVSRHKDLHF